jgi:hypothetical protein
MQLCVLVPDVFAAPVSAEATVDKTDVFVGEPFTLQIQVMGSESPDQPKLPAMGGFNVAFVGGTQNSSTSIQIVNGRMSKDIRKGYIFSYRLTPLRKGKLLIPAITVMANGNSAVTRPIPITAREPEEIDDFKLRIHLSKTRIYVGEPVILGVTWYLGSDVRNAAISFPWLQNDNGVYIFDQKVNISAQKAYYRVPLNDGEVIGEKGKEILNGNTYGTLRFEKVLIFEKPGDVAIDPATVSFQALVGYRKRNDPFDDDFFSNFFNDRFSALQREGVYQQFVIPSNAISLTVMDLPAKGRPADFSGLVGNYHLTASAKPVSVNVGDPITLTLELSGSPYLQPVKLPQLSQQPALVRDFKIPAEQADGEVTEGKKIFTQTLRPLRADVKEIPPVTLSYFDTQDGIYKTARTEAIPLEVSPTRIVTARDAEGFSRPVAVGSEVETFSGGIAHNYEDSGVLSNQIHNPVAWVMSVRGAATLVVPPILYLLFLGGSFFYQMKTADPAGARAKHAFTRLQKKMKQAKQGKNSQQMTMDLLDAVKNYLGDKLRIPAGALTFMDVRDPLIGRGADLQTLEGLKMFFAECEAARYGGAPENSETVNLYDRVQDLVKTLEKIL